MFARLNLFGSDRESSEDSGSFEKQKGGVARTLVNSWLRKQQRMAGVPSEESGGLGEVDGVWSFLQSIDWRDPWLACLAAFHVLVTSTTLLTRNHGNVQVLLFAVMLMLVYFSESINEIAANNWRRFSKQQYFDTKGMFISLVLSVPMLLNCMIMVANWLWQSSELMTQLRVAQLRQRQRRLREEPKKEN